MMLIFIIGSTEFHAANGQNRLGANTHCFIILQMSRNVRKATMWFPTRSDTNRAVQPQKKARGLKFHI